MAGRFQKGNTMNLFIKGNVSDEGALNHVTQQEAEPHDSDQRKVVVYALGGAFLCLVASGIVAWLGG
jgi:hypothetical protein